ncbi:hypothetical protein [Ekhidna sp.]|uniref:hypothetical protein n=1 Tax=Ekhidna sp. TaxID=2608089 RepID=UPI0032EF873A
MKYLRQFEDKPENLFGKLFWNMFFFLAFWMVPLSLLILFGVIPFNFNDQPYYGIGGFLMALSFIPMMALGFAAIFWLYYSIGNYFLRLFNRIF